MINQIPDKRPFMSKKEIEFMFMHLCLSSQVLYVGLKYIKSYHFDSISEPHYGVMWSAITSLASEEDISFINKDGVYPKIVCKIKEILSSNPNLLTEEMEEELLSDSETRPGLVRWCTDKNNEKHINVGFGIDLVKRFLLERDVYRGLSKEISDSRVPVDIINLFDKYGNKAREISSVGDDPVESAALTDKDRVEIEKFSTGVDFLDRYMMGGQAKREVYGILGPTGVGKTLLATQICCQCAINELNKEKTLSEMGVKYEPEHWYYFTYEAPSYEVKRRMTAYLADIDISRLENIPVDKLNSSGYLEYERIRFPEMVKDGSLPTEMDRYKRSVELLSRNCWVIGMSGGSRYSPDRGSGYVDEIFALLSKECEKGRKIGGFIVDYAGEACKRHMLAKGIKFDYLRHYLGMFAKRCLQQVCEPFDCVGWILHQLNTEANKRSAGAIPHHSYAAEAGNFAENVWFCFCLGTKDISRNACILNCSKSRRAPPMSPIPVIIDGAFNRMINAEKKLIIDSTMHSIVDCNEIYFKSDEGNKRALSRNTTGELEGFIE